MLITSFSKPRFSESLIFLNYFVVIPLKVQETEEQLPCTWFYLKITVLFVSETDLCCRFIFLPRNLKSEPIFFLLKALSLLESSSLTLKQTYSFS